MFLRALTAAVAVIVVPVAVVGAQTPEKKPATEKRTCRVDSTIGSRLGGTRRCETPSEREARRADARRTVDRVQAMKATVCSPQIPC